MGKLLSVINGSTLLSGWDDFLDVIYTLVGQVLWLLCDLFFILLDLFESIFRMFAGLSDSVKAPKTNEAIEGDLVLYFINSDLVQEIFFSILALSLVLLVIFTIFAVVKNQYAEKQEPVSKIINGSFKALLLYLLVPVATVVCLMVGNVVLQAIDGATRPTDAASASDMLFIAGSYNANKLRDETPEEIRKNLEYMLEHGFLNSNDAKWTAQMESCGIVFGDKDSAYTVPEAYLDDIADLVDEAFTNDLLSKAQSDKWNFYVVFRYYHVSRISLITIWAGGAFLIWAIGKITWGMVARLFKMVLYFAISPAVLATYPIQGDKPLASWRGEMVKNGTSAYCAIGVLNVLYSILPFFNDIKLGFFGQWGTSIVRLFIYIIAFSSAQSLISTISSWFGTGDALKEGKEASKTVTDQLKKRSGQVMGTIGAYRGGAKAAKDQGKKGFGQFLGGAAGVFGTTDYAKSINDTKKAFKEGQDTGSAQYKTFATSNFIGVEDKKKLAQYEAREAVKKQTDAIDKAEAKLDETFKMEAATRGYAEGSDAYKKLQKRYEKEKQALRENAQFVSQLYEGQDKVLESMLKKSEKDSADFAVFDNWAKSQATINKYREMFKQFFKNGNMTEAQFQKIMNGDFSNMSRHMDGKNDAERSATYQRMKETYQLHASGMFESQQNSEMAFQGIQNMAKVGGHSQEFLVHIQDELVVKEETVDVNGEQKTVITEVADVKDVTKLMDKIEQVRENVINAQIAENEKLRQAIKSGKLATYDTGKAGKLTPTDLGNIKPDK